MFRYSLSWYLFTFTLLELIIKTHLIPHDSSHGFINKNSKYLEDDFKSIHEELSSGLRSAQMNDFNLNLRLEPSILDFKQRQLGIAHLEKVTLFNTDKNRSIDMTSISGSTAYFHSSFFESKKIPPNGNTTFNVVFLGREEGLVEGNLFIHSSDGYFKYNVKGATTYSRFRLRPIVGVKLPLNSTFSPLIYLYNPHPKPVQITEVYSSGGDFHLELPSGDQEGPNDLWEIPPYQTKAIIRVRFKAKVVQNHTAYVRIKLNSQSELLVVPLEVEVTPNGELVHPQGGIDFGIGGNLDPPKEVKLCVSNPMKKPVRVHSVTTTSKAIEVNFEPTRIPPDIGDKGGCTEIGTLTLNWKKAFDKNDFSGKILVKYRQGRNASVIPYYLTVLDGGLTFDPLQTSYFVEDAFADLTTRDFVIRNDFYSPVEIVQFEIHPDANKYFKVESFTPTILKPTNEKKIFRLRLRYGMNLSAVNLNSQIILKTNITDVVIPILSYKGKIKLYLPFKGPDDTLDIGLISYNTQKNVYFLIANPNPVSLVLKTIRSSIPMTNMELMGCKRGNYEEAILNVKHKNLTNCINVKPNHYAVIKLTVQTSGSEGQIWGDVYVETQYEQMSIPVHFRVAPGKLEIGPDRLVFDQCFPGKICSHPLRVHSTFREPMIIENIMSLPPDKRIYSKHSGHILAGTTKVVGHLYLNPNVECNNECYTGFVDDSTSQWLNTLSLDFAYDIDVYLLNVLYNRYLNETANGLRKWQNLTIRIDTSEVKGHIFKTRVKMSWPSLLINENVENRSLFVFPTTQIGNISYRNISLRNPSAHPLVVQLVLDKHYGNIAQLYKDIPPSFLPERSKEFQQYGFFFVDHKKYLKEFYGNVDWPCSEDSVPLLLGPGENITVTVGFRAEETNFISSMMVIRNNLTILEFLTVRGQGVHPQFKFGNRKPGSEQPLSFEMTERHLRDCEKDKQQINVTPNLTVKRSFTARNIGDVTIYVNSFYINDYPCEGYGFKVINCVPFALPPNGTRKIDIAFTPDLTLSKVMRTLILGTSLNFPVNYTLYTTIPAHYLHMCSELIMRPYWEIYMSYLINIFMILLLFVIVFLAVMDAERIKKQAFGELLANTTTSIQPVLDLRMVGQQAREEIRTLKVEKNDNNNSVEIKTAQKKEEKANNNNKLQLSNGVHKQKPKEEVLEQPKYHAMIPVTGKTKKKLGKRNSNDYSVDTPETVQKKSPDTFKPFKLKMEEKKPTSCTSTASVPPTKSVKPIVSNKKVNYTKNTNVPAVSEEETSSTTTECSSNDDPEKEKDQSNQKICSKKTADKHECVKQTVGEELQEFEETNDVKQDVISQNNKVERQKLAPKTKTKPSKELHESTKTDSQGSKSNRESKKSKAQRERKEKLQLKKQSSDKNNTLTNGKTIESQARKSPQIPSKSIWGENCATFSDVVARTESLSTNRPLCQKPNFKPTMYVEPYQQTQTDLGPVGSRRLEYYGDAYLSHTNLESSNSFFSTNHEIRPENNVNYFEDLLQTDNWNQDFSSLGNQDVFSDPAVPFPMDDPWNHNLLDSNLYWQNNFGLTPQPEPVENSSTPNSIQEQMNYLWGSSPVWQPWTPAETPRTPTRTPPGFDEFVQPRSRNEMQYPPQPIQNQPQRESYSPFPTSTIWNPDPLNPWNYNQGQ